MPVVFEFDGREEAQLSIESAFRVIFGVFLSVCVGKSPYK